MKSVLYVLFPILVALPLWADVANEKKLEESKPETETEVKPAAPTEGPHQGHLLSAGNFNLEVVWDKNLTAQVYLLDAEYKNETVQNSEVGIFMVAGNVESEMSCQTVENHFECKQNGKKFKKGELSISAKRNGSQGEEIKLKVPIEKKSAEDKKTKESKKK